VQFLGDEAGQRAAVGLVGPLLLEGEQVLLQHLEKGGLFRLPAGIGVAGRRFCACRCLHEGGCRSAGHGSCLSERATNYRSVGPRKHPPAVLARLIELEDAFHDDPDFGRA
jgi:hypothetical protein